MRSNDPLTDTSTDTENRLKVGVIGAGAIGSALGELMTANGRAVKYWDHEPAKRTAVTLEELVTSSRIIILCVSTAAVGALAAEVAAVERAAAKRVTAEQAAAAQNAGDRRLLVTVAKGVADGFVTADQLLAQAVEDRFDVGVFYGPMLAAEVARQGRLAGILAVSDERWFGSLDGAFGERSRVEYSSGVRSVAVCGVLKNVYSLAFGLAAGLGWGNNDRGRLLVAIMAEFRPVLAALGGEPGDAEGLAGLGDLLATGSSDLSFNYRAGVALATGGRAAGEGVNSLRQLTSTLDAGKYPIVSILSRIAFDGAEADLLARVVAFSNHSATML